MSSLVSSQEENLQGRNKPYITKNKRLLRKPARIEGSPYYVEVNLSQAFCKKLSYTLLELCGFSESDMTVEERH